MVSYEISKYKAYDGTVTEISNTEYTFHFGSDSTNGYFIYTYFPTETVIDYMQMINLTDNYGNKIVYNDPFTPGGIASLSGYPSPYSFDIQFLATISDSEPTGNEITFESNSSIGGELLNVSDKTLYTLTALFRTIPANKYLMFVLKINPTITIPSSGFNVNVKNLPESIPLCFIGTSSILCQYGYKKISKLNRKDKVVCDIATKKILPISKIYKTFINSKICKIPIGMFGNIKNIVGTDQHPIWCNNEKNRILIKDIPNIQKIKFKGFVYSLQFEEEGSYYVNGIKVDSISPHNRGYPLPKNLYFDINKFIDYKLKSEDDPFRNKPLMIQQNDFVNIKYHSFYFILRKTAREKKFTKK